MKRSIVIIAAIVTVFYACTHDVIKPNTPTTSSGGNTTSTGTGTGQGTGTTNSVCFQTDVLPLFQTYCASAGCHDGTSNGEDNNLALTNYSNIMTGIVANSPNESKYFTIIQDGSMPPRNSPKLSAAQIATISQWITEGASNNTCVITTCDTTKTTYSNGVSQIFATYCNGCHGVAPGSGNVILSDYANAKAAGTGMKTNFLNAINYTSALAAMNMPQAGKLSSCQVTQITKWINSGCPQ